MAHPTIDRARVLFEDDEVAAAEALLADPLSGDDEADRLELLGRIATSRAQGPEAVTLLERALAIRIEQHGKTGVEAARGHAALARHYLYRAETDQGIAAATRAVKISKGDPRWLTLRGNLELVAGDMAAAEKSYQLALKKLRGAARLDALRGLGNVHIQQGNGRKAKQRFEQALALTEDDGYIHATILAGLGQATSALGEHEEAIAYFEQAVPMLIETAGETHAEVAIGLTNLALAWSEVDAFHAAAATQYAIAVGEHAYAIDHPFHAAALGNLAYFCSELGRPEAAIEHGERELAILERTRPPWHIDVARSLSNLANYHRESGHDELAVTRARQLVALAPELAKTDQEIAAAIMFSTATILLEVGKDMPAAAALYGTALGMRERLRDADDEVLLNTARNAAAILFEAGAVAQAIELLEAARARWTDDDFTEILDAKLVALRAADREGVIEDTEREDA